ncbi:hypothetical protein [Streptomyces sp. NPDC046197]|uniref:hypothetical protein n=1 Tax=Streptomyces sp. NPDC046197 TaxID=3154337 RepID=UPI0033E377DE
MMRILERRSAVIVTTALLTATGIAAPAAAVSAPAKDAIALRPTDVNINKNVTFGGGVPVGGWYSLTVFPTGSYNYSGHMHDSGAPSYNLAGVCVVRFKNGTAFVFQTAGRMHGTFESGSRDYNWNTSGSRRAIADAWRASRGSWKASCNSKVNADLHGMVNSAMQAVGYASTVIGIVA